MLPNECQGLALALARWTQAATKNCTLCFYTLLSMSDYGSVCPLVRLILLGFLQGISQAPNP
jgi:hypothetical protein